MHVDRWHWIDAHPLRIDQCEWRWEDGKAGQAGLVELGMGETVQFLTVGVDAAFGVVYSFRCVEWMCECC